MKLSLLLLSFTLSLSSPVTEQKDNKNVTLNCSVSTYWGCGHNVKWLYHGRDVGKDNNNLKTSTFNCRTSVTFMTSHFIYTSEDYYKMLMCNVTDYYTGKVITFSLQSSGEKTGEMSCLKSLQTNMEITNCMC